MKRYLIGISNNIHKLGNEGTCITHYKAPYKIKELAYKFSKMHHHQEVYLIKNYTQKMCELNSIDFVTYVKTNGEKLI